MYIRSSSGKLWYIVVYCVRHANMSVLKDHIVAIALLPVHEAKLQHLPTDVCTLSRLSVAASRHCRDEEVRWGLQRKHRVDLFR